MGHRSSVSWLRPSFSFFSFISVFLSLLVETVAMQAMEDVDKLLFQITPVRLLYLFYLLFSCFYCCRGCCGYDEMKMASDISMGLCGVWTIVHTSNTPGTKSNLLSRSLYFLSFTTLFVTVYSTADS